MNKDVYGEIINGEETYETISKQLLDGKSVIIGWTDGGYDHRDILFTLKPKKIWNITKGFKLE